MEIVLGGEEGSVTLAGSPEGRVERVALQVGPLTGQIETVIGVDLVRMREDLSAALTSLTLTGVTRVESVEHDFSLSVEIANGKGSIRGTVTTQFRDDGGTFVLTTDQSYLHETLRQLVEATLSGAS